MVKILGRMAVLAVAVMAPALLSGCLGDDQAAQDPGLVGTASIALTGVPADGTCIVIEAHGNRTVSRAVDAPAGSMMVVAMSGLPTGQVTFNALAFGSSCATRGAMPANWVSDASFTVTVSVSPPAIVTLNLVRNGMANVSVGFNDDAPTPDGGAADGGSSGGSSPGAAEALMFLQLDAITGESTEPGLVGAFDLRAFNLVTSTTVPVSGGGGGAGKTTFQLSASTKYQKGVPVLYTTSATGKHVRTATVTVKKKKADKKVDYYVVTLTDVLISSVSPGPSAGGEIPDVSLSLAFAAIKIDFRGAQNPDGTPGPVTSVEWDLARNVGSGPGTYLFDFVLGGVPDATHKAITTFRAPSEQISGSPTGGGGGAGKAVFSDSSIGLPVDADVLRYLAVEATGRHTAMGSVALDVAGPSGPTPFATFGFKDIIITGMTISGPDATVSFDSAAFSWTTFGPGGAMTTMFDTKTGKI